LEQSVGFIGGVYGRKYMLFKKLSNIFKDDSESWLKGSHFKIFLDDGESTDEFRVSEVIGWAKNKGYLAKLSISEDNAEVLFRSMLIEHDLPEELKQVVMEKAREGAPLHPDEAHRIKELIASGEVFHDIFYSFKVIFSLANPDHSTKLDESFKGYIKAIIVLPRSFLFDLNPNDAFENLSAQIARLKVGESPDDSVILDNTLKTIFSVADVGNIIDAINALLAPENETLRIALSVYARLNGINLEQQDIDKVRETILDRDNPQLGSLFSYLLVLENTKRLAGG
jgi:hypothetical protein